MVKIDPVWNQFGRCYLNLAPDEYIHPLKCVICEKLLDKVLADCARGANNKSFHRYVEFTFSYYRAWACRYRAYLMKCMGVHGSSPRPGAGLPPVAFSNQAILCAKARMVCRPS